MSQDPHDQLLLQIRGAVAEYERVLIAERMRRGRQMKLKAGALLPWTIPPYGYRSAPDRPRGPPGVQIEPEEAAVVREWFARYLEDKGTLLSLARHLLQLRLPSPRGNQRWSAASIRGLLINPVYTGQLYIGRSRSRSARIRRFATHPLGNPARGLDSTPAETWIRIGTVPALVNSGGLRAPGKTDGGLPDGDHPNGRVPTTEVRAGTEKSGAGGSNEGTGGPGQSAGGVGSVGLIESRISAAESTPVLPMQRLIRNARRWNCWLTGPLWPRAKSRFVT